MPTEVFSGGSDNQALMLSDALDPASRNQADDLALLHVDIPWGGGDEWWDVLFGSAIDVLPSVPVAMPLSALTDVADDADTTATTDNPLLWDGTEWKATTDIIDGGAP